MVGGGKSWHIFRRLACAEGLGQRDQDRLGFAGDDRVGDRSSAVVLLHEVTAVEPGVEAEEADVGAGIGGTGFEGRVETDAQGSVHGHGNGDQVGGSRCVCREILDGQVYCCRVKADGAQGGQRPGQAERLVAEFVAGDQQD